MSITKHTVLAALTVVTVALLMMLLIASAASAEEQCFLLSPFDDELTMEFVQPAEGVDLFIVQLGWDGAGVYALDGGGEATLNSADTKAVLYATLHNPSSFFGGNPVCRFNAVLALPNLQGPWFMDCGRRAAANPTFEVAGTLIPQACGGEGTARFNVQREKQDLAGERR